MRRKLLLGALVIPLIAVGAIIGAAILGAFGTSDTDGTVFAQTGQQGSNMESRLNQVMRVLESDPGPEAVGTALDEGLEVLYGGIRVLPTLPDKSDEGVKILEQTTDAHERISEMEMVFAKALEDYAFNGGDGELRGRALDLKLFVEQMNEVAQALGNVTRQCGDGADLNQAPCDDLAPILDEVLGAEISATTGQLVDANRVGAQQIIVRGKVHPSYSFKLRSPFIPPWIRNWDEDVVLTDPIAPGECAVVFKETRGLMIRVHFERMTVVRDPWVATFGVPRGTKLPVWSIEWVPSEYGKEWNICNVNGSIKKTVTQRVVQDVPLNFFWRYYPRAR